MKWVMAVMLLVGLVFAGDKANMKTYKVVDLEHTGGCFVTVEENNHWYALREMFGGYYIDPVGLYDCHLNIGVGVTGSVEGKFGQYMVLLIPEGSKEKKHKYLIKNDGSTVGLSVGKPPTDEELAASIGYTQYVVDMLRADSKDPDSFRLVQALAVIKHGFQPKVEYYGCIRYSGTNSYGGRVHECTMYNYTRSGPTLFGNECPCSPNEHFATVSDVTSKMK